jgi:hypothetical protein
MLEPGEGVVTKNAMAALGDQAKNPQSSGPHYHAHINPTYNVQTIDGDGMQDALDKHTDVLTKHFEKSLRKMNR